MKPSDVGELISVELHHFSDASSTGYETSAHTCGWIDDKHQAHCPFVIGKARVSPIKPVDNPPTRVDCSSCFERK